MKGFIDKIIKPKKTEVKEVATEAMVEAIVKKVDTPKKPNHFPDCNCFKCMRWQQENASK